MKSVVLRPNAVPLYYFLSVIADRPGQGETSRGKKILDCGAGGMLPPVALFHQQGFDTWGIDRSDEQLDKARQFCRGHGMEVHLCKGDMRHIPFGDESCDYVYEHYSMCHLSKADTQITIQEMRRVLKKKGLCFLGFISDDSWPKSMFGEEREPGEFWGRGRGGEPTLHSVFTDEETDRLVTAWDVLSKEKRVTYLRDEAEKISLEEWMERYYREARDGCPPEAWQARYAKRANEIQYAHVYYLLEKQA